MTTVLAVYNSEGCVGRCDSKCHDAHEPDCKCICGGRNHGKGTARAIENTREHIEHFLSPERRRTFAIQNGVTATHTEAPAAQDALF